MISIIIPALNEEKYLPALLTSLSKQTSRNFEVIVVDGKSKDKTVSVAQSFASSLPYLRVIVADHANLPYQRNVGTEQAAGDWYVFLDADNVMLSHAIERIICYVEEQKPSLFTSWSRPDSENPNDAIVALIANILFEGSILFKRPFSPGPFTGVSRSVFDVVGGFTAELSWGEDADFSNKVGKAGYDFTVIHETLYIWSLRRFRKDGKAKIFQQYAKAVFYALFTNKALTKMPGYIMGGQAYGKKKKINTSVLRKLHVTLKKLMNEVFE